MVRIGTAGWVIPAGETGALARAFPGEGRHLERYGRVLSGVEINSSFHRAHRVGTYARWGASVPEGFRFAVKVPRAATHTLRLVGAGEVLRGFLAEVAGLGARLGPLLVQLPPSLVFDEAVAGAFFAGLRDVHGGAVVCEPRHGTWFEAGAEALLRGFEVARVAADPAVVPVAGEPGGWDGLAYWRLHGSPRMYYSQYGAAWLDGLAARVVGSGVETWCMFDNTAAGHALGDALGLVARVRRGG